MVRTVTSVVTAGIALNVILKLVNVSVLQDGGGSNAVNVSGVIVSFLLPDPKLSPRIFQ